jgi:hypothetical protein
LFDALVGRFGLGNLFMDVDTIAPGSDYVAAIHAGLAKCDVMLVVIGPAWLDDRLNDPGDLVRLEVAAALRSEALVVPVLVGGAQMPAAAALPDDLKALATRNSFRLSDERWATELPLLEEVVDGSETATIDLRIAGPRAWIRAGDDPPIELTASVVRLGRSPDNDVVIDDDTRISRRHAELVRHADRWSVRDCQSSNGTFLNGEAVTDATIRSGDVIRVGACVLTFTAEDDSFATTAAEG